MSKFIVTGGGGFVGKALALALKKRGADVVSVSRGQYPELTQAGIVSVQADVGKDLQMLKETFIGAEAVFHTASKVAMWGKYQDFFQSNVIGTKNVIAACKASAVRKLIYTSSPSVIASGGHLRGVDESVPYPKRFKAFYPMTKAMAEQAVLAANSKELLTLALRPHLIWGPGDNNLVPSIIRRAKANQLIRVGNGSNLVDTTYIDDCVAAHLCAEQALDKSPRASGRAYFISQGEPVSLWGWIDSILNFHHLPAVKKSVPYPVAYCLAAVLEIISLLRRGMPEPRFTRFLASEMATDHYFNITAAREELGYQPRWSIDQALKHTFEPLSR
jgi:nucleoside-diphosphate-sugar epimerase